jgi:hypothetical protein
VDKERLGPDIKIETASKRDLMRRNQSAVKDFLSSQELSPSPVTK